MVGKVSERVLLREGLERTDNGMKQSSWPEVPPINQKNYYTEYMKRDDQVLALRIQGDAARDRLVQTAKDRDRVLAQNGDLPLPSQHPPPPEDGTQPPLDASDPSKIIVIHPGSQNLRIGFASDALPKTIPMVVATKWPQTEDEEHEALPRRQFEATNPDQKYGEEWSKRYQRMSNDLKIDMRANKRKVLPNSKELVQNFNRRTKGETIPKHNDPIEVEWTDIGQAEDPSSLASCFIGHQALLVPNDSIPKYKLWWPMRHGWLNEDEYTSAERLHDDFETILDQAIRNELGLTRNSTWPAYSCVFVIPDLYDKKYVEMVLRSCMTWFEFNKICFIQESTAGTFGAGYTQACVVDVGAQKTSITCVEDGLCIEDSRVNLKFGGYDVTETFIKMMLYDNLPYEHINLQRRYDFLLAEELKIKYCTLSQENIKVLENTFHVRAPNQLTQKYNFKLYDEGLLASMGLYEPAVFDNSTKLRGRRKLIERSYNAYDVDFPDDPVSAAQFAVLAHIKPSIASVVSTGSSLDPTATPSKDRPQPFNYLNRSDLNGGGTPATSKAPSPAPDGASTPVPAPFIFGAGARDPTATNGTSSPAPSGRNGGTPAPPPSSVAAAAGAPPGSAAAASAAAATTTTTTTTNTSTNTNTTIATNGAATQQQPPPGIFVDSVTRSPKALAAERDSVLPVVPLDVAIMMSIQNAAKGEEKKLRDLLGSVMVVGGGSKVPNFAPYLEERLKALCPDLHDKILVSRSARDMDEQVVVWKGASVFAKLPTNDSWITPGEFERLDSRVLYHKVLWAW